MIKIAILEDLKEVAAMLCDIINEQEDMQCMQTYHTAEDAILFLPQHPIDILIVDIGLPRSSGIEAIKQLKISCPTLQFCMFTVYDDDDKIFMSLQAGAKGYILKTAATEKIMEAIKELYEGGSPMSPSIARRVIEALTSAPFKSQNPVLPVTPRELELLELLAKGMLYKEISDRLGITLGTVKQHIHKIYDKLQVTNRTEAINKYHNRDKT